MHYIPTSPDPLNVLERRPRRPHHAQCDCASHVCATDDGDKREDERELIDGRGKRCGEDIFKEV